MAIFGLFQGDPYTKLALEVWSYMNGKFLANSFLGFNYVFSVQVWYICLNLIDLRKKKYILFIQNWI